MGNQASHGGGGGDDPTAFANGASMTEAELRARGISRMDKELQQKFRSANGGVTYRLRVVIRGDRCTGKSALLKRLEGGDFTAEHTPTPEIATAYINWSYKATEETVVVEVWDCVDKGKSNKARMALTKDTIGVVVPPVDASVVDVYKDCHAVIICEWSGQIVLFQLLKLRCVCACKYRVSCVLTTQLQHMPQCSIRTAAIRFNTPRRR
jgi:hypothetical protein